MVPRHAFVCGGSEIYRLFWPLVDMIYLTQVTQPYKGDTLFPFDINQEFSLKEILYEDQECIITQLVKGTKCTA
jgi:dihydrofolate reductase